MPRIGTGWADRGGYWWVGVGIWVVGVEEMGVNGDVATGRGSCGGASKPALRRRLVFRRRETRPRPRPWALGSGLVLVLALSGPFWYGRAETGVYSSALVGLM